MNKEYEIIIRDVLKKYRKDNSLSQEAMAEKINYSRSHLARMESGERSISPSSAKYIIETLNIDFIIDKNTIDEFNSVFDNFYISIVKEDKTSIEEYHKYIIDNKDRILKSLCMYRYYVYNLYYRTYIKTPIDLDEIKSIENRIDYLSNKDKQLFYDLTGIYYRFNNNPKMAMTYYKKSLKINEDKLIYAMTLLHMVRIFTTSNRYSKSIKYIIESKNILKRYKMKERVINCDIHLALAYSFMKDYEASIEIYKRLLKDPDIINNISKYNIVINNLLWTYFRSNKYRSIGNNIKKIPDKYKMTLRDNVYAIILHYYFMNDDKESFNEWVDYFKDEEDDALQRMIIEIYCMYFNGTDVRELLGKVNSASSDDEDYIMILNSIKDKLKSTISRI